MKTIAAVPIPEGFAFRPKSRLMRPETAQYIMSATKELADLLGISLEEVLHA